MEFSQLDKIFYGWGRLISAKYADGSFPRRISHCVSFIAPKLKSMEFDVETQQKLLSSFMKGVFFSFRQEFENPE